MFTVTLLLREIEFQASFSSREHARGHCILLVCEHVTNLNLQLLPLLKLADSVHTEECGICVKHTMFLNVFTMLKT